MYSVDTKLMCWRPKGGAIMKSVPKRYPKELKEQAVNGFVQTLTQKLDRFIGTGQISTREQLFDQSLYR